MKPSQSFIEGPIFAPLVSFLMSRQRVISLFHIGLATPASTVVQMLLCAVYFAFLGRAASARAAKA